MFNSPALLLTPAKSGKDYTHIVRVGDSGSLSNPKLFGFSSMGGLVVWGAMVPNTFNERGFQGEIYYLSSSEDEGLEQISFACVAFYNVDIEDIPKLYIGRPDTRMTSSNIINFTPSLGAFLLSGELFSSFDVGKDIPVWISFSPPPVEPTFRWNPRFWSVANAPLFREAA